MKKKTNVTRMVLIGAALGAGVAGTLTLPMVIPAVMASEPVQAITEAVQDVTTPGAPTPLFEADDFVKFKSRGRSYTVTADASVSTEVNSMQTIKKIGFGKMTHVTVVTTPTGVYSSDALRSPHVRYPGISVTADPTIDDVIRELQGIDGIVVPVYEGSFVVLVIGT